MNTPIAPEEHLAGPESATRPVNWSDFREHLATADKDGNRRWLYPKKPTGRFYRYRTYLSWLLIAVMFSGPFIRIHGNPLLMINIIERKFSILGQIFWPEDMIIFAVAMLLFLTSIMIFTAAFGRLWCGWTCPQTVMMEMVFRKIEYLFEGDGAAQKAFDAAPWTISKAGKKLAKHIIFFGLSFLVGNTLLSYIIGSDQLYHIVTDDPRNHLGSLAAMVLFTLVFYSIFARFREQACVFICPYGRFQSVILDENSMVVAYDYKRGEKRAPWKKGETIELRQAEGHGDCVNCHQCVAVCPTGIDIRNGTQMECVNCTSCIDACDGIMDKIGRPRGLVRYASLNGIERGEHLRVTTRMKLYSGILMALASGLMLLIFTRADVETLLLRAPGALYQAAPEGRISNLYTIKVVNKTRYELPIDLRLENVTGRITLMGGGLTVGKEKLAQTSVLVELPPESMTGHETKLSIGVYSGGKCLETVKTIFIGPRT
jgi:cytochrome c oxidase accessory protein FixG